MALRCGPKDYHFIREINGKWYNKSGTFIGNYVTKDDILADRWYAQGIDPYTREHVVDKSMYYEGTIIFYALKVTWDEQQN